VLKNFRRVDVLRKYFNTKILLVQHRSREERMDRCCGCEKRRNYHRTFTSKAVTGVFAVFATGKYTVTSVSVEREHVEWRGV